MSTEAEIEAAARALYEHAAPHSAIGWEGFASQYVPSATSYRDHASAALAAAEPLIRERLAQEVEAVRREHKATFFPTAWYSAMDRAARIVRGDAS